MTTVPVCPQSTWDILATVMGLLREPLEFGLYVLGIRREKTECPMVVARAGLKEAEKPSAGEFARITLAGNIVVPRYRGW